MAKGDNPRSMSGFTGGSNMLGNAIDMNNGQNPYGPQPQAGKFGMARPGNRFGQLGQGQLGQGAGQLGQMIAGMRRPMPQGQMMPQMMPQAMPQQSPWGPSGGFPGIVDNFRQSMGNPNMGNINVGPSPGMRPGDLSNSPGPMGDRYRRGQIQTMV